MPNFQIGETALGESDSDSDSDSVVCGKRKRGEIQETEKIDSSGCDGDIAKIDSSGCGGEIAKIDSGVGSDEKTTRQVEKFEDIYGLFQRYGGKMHFEDEDYDWKDEYYSYDEAESWDEEIENGGMVKEIKKDDAIKEYGHETVLKYISQVRNSFGFDVDVRVPYCLVDYLSFIPLELSLPRNHDPMYMATKFAIDEINVDMKSKTYELVEVAKAVVVDDPCSLLFLTLVVKKVEAATMSIQAIVYRPIPNTFELPSLLLSIYAL